MNKQLYVGNQKLNFESKKVVGEFVTLYEERFYKISNFDHMAPFFMSIVSDSDQWLYIWSNGALTAGRQNADHALFPYYTDDKIKDAAAITGSRTVCHVKRGDKLFLWEPLIDACSGAYRIERNLYKNIYSNKLIFEEINRDLQLCYRYAWMTSDRFGFVKKSTLINLAEQPVTVELLDGIQNILPAGVERAFQNEFSTLADAYKKNELQNQVGLGLYSLSSIPVDRAEPSESLRATTVWSDGIDARNILLSSNQLDAFRQGAAVNNEDDIHAARGAYFIHAGLTIPAEKEEAWYFVAEVDQDSARVSSLINYLENNLPCAEEIEADINRGTENLKHIIARADGLQASADDLISARHFSNVLFNVLRGGVFEDGYAIELKDFYAYIAAVDKENYKSLIKMLDIPGDQTDYQNLLSKATESGSAALLRLCYEYLPLSFSRRHGDPSRPWNMFSIDIRDDEGNKKRNYEGNWRDIFQNWEALAISFPEYLEAMITRFVNASTADGYNPYRLTREGIDWEELDPNDPWSYIGYWGDHQIIYLTKLLEFSNRVHPNRLDDFLNKRLYTYAHVPYRIKDLESILENPYDTVVFDSALNRQIKERCLRSGEKAKYIQDGKGELFLVTLMEKLLVPVLAKVSNFIPEAGIWLNTQRPEWNDANNALVGNGASMVTLYYLRRHINFILNLLQQSKTRTYNLSEEVASWFKTSATILDSFRENLNSGFSNEQRKNFAVAQGQAGSDYRTRIYENGFSGAFELFEVDDLKPFLTDLLHYIDQSIRANRRQDNLYHAYNLITITEQGMEIRHLYKMLEGQVAVLSSGFVTPEEAVRLLDALRNSNLYRKDQATYLLYPDRRLPRFTDKNNISSRDIKNSKLLSELVRSGNSDVVVCDQQNGHHFNGDLRNAAVLRERLNNLGPAQGQAYRKLVEEEADQIVAVFEKMFDHQSFTGRSGTFYKYEGLGSTYWHMVSKLALAVQECYLRAKDEGAVAQTLVSLDKHYKAIKEGIGVHKSPALYGAFPTDPYSHTPAGMGVQQPGMTGQVKEDILSRFAELGVSFEDGAIAFKPHMLQLNEFYTEPQEFTYYDVVGQHQSIQLKAGTLAFTLAQVPVIYHQAKENKLILRFTNGDSTTISGLSLDKQTSVSIFNRAHKLRDIQVFIDIN